MKAEIDVDAVIVADGERVGVGAGVTVDVFVDDREDVKENEVVPLEALREMVADELNVFVNVEVEDIFEGDSDTDLDVDLVLVGIVRVRVGVGGGVTVSVTVIESDAEGESLAVDDALRVGGGVTLVRLRLNVLLNVRLLVLEGNPSALGKFFFASTSLTIINEKHITASSIAGNVRKYPRGMGNGSI